MTIVTSTTDQINASRRLFQLCDHVTDERSKWSDPVIRTELTHIAVQLELAARMALSSSEIWGDAWAEAGTITLRQYIGARKLIEHVRTKS